MRNESSQAPKARKFACAYASDVRFAPSRDSGDARCDGSSNHRQIVQISSAPEDMGSVT
jgi:hypothetical protein